jgi:tetraacyldisaccharide 4'-kinase
LLDLLYAGAARWRRRAAERHPERRRRLGRPVISVGNLSVGGTGKTPVVASLLTWLVARGERPAVLSRGYGRRETAAGVVVVADGRGGPLAPLARAGDEPLMLARAVSDAIVCVSADRYLAGTLAERVLGATVHVLDDGFQHLSLHRDLDILVTTAGEIPAGRVLPRGRLREPSDAAARAHVLVVVGATPGAATAEAWTLGVSLSCGARRVPGEPVRVATRGQSSGGTPKPRASSLTPRAVAASAAGAPAAGSRVVAACGIANPHRFVEDLRAAGWSVAREVTFPDHHQYTPRDVVRLAAVVAETGATAVLTTDKDAVRFEALGEAPFALYRVPVTLEFDPPVLFESVAQVMAAARDAEPRSGPHLTRAEASAPGVVGGSVPSEGDEPSRGRVEGRARVRGHE